MIDYAKVSSLEKWLRHPSMGDPSFDTFEKIGDTVHVSQFPYEWAVNGSLFIDFDGTWYLYAGLYGYGYYPSIEGGRSHFEIYRSRDEGKTWENLGRGLQPGFRFEGFQDTSSGCPDAVVMYDRKRKKYLLSYDWSTDNHTWALAHDSNGSTADSGAAVAWGDTPAGPFERVSVPVFTNKKLHGKYGRFDRFYGTTVIPRENDYLALILCDTGPNFAWGLAAATAKTPEEGFDMPNIVLSADRNDYYPTPMEYFPSFVHDGIVYAPATSVAGNRNYQHLFAAPLEEAHKPEAWKLVQAGCMWHSRPLEDEKYGIWGQTFHGCIDSEGNFRVMYPSKDGRDFGTLSVATRKWDEPVSDGFTISGHAAPAVSIVRDAYRTFDLETDFSLHGTADFLFGFHGKIGAEKPEADYGPNATALTEYTALRVCGCEWQLVDHGNILLSGTTDKDIRNIRVHRNLDSVCAWANDRKLFDAQLAGAQFAGIGIRMEKFSVLTCSRMEVNGECKPASFRYTDIDALQGGGVGDINFRMEDGVRVGNARVKWSIEGGSFKIIGRRGPEYGEAIVRVDGQQVGSITFRNDSVQDEAVLFEYDLPFGRYGVDLLTTWKSIPVPEIVVSQTDI